jgi:hypothetical protein
MIARIGLWLLKLLLITLLLAYEQAFSVPYLTVMAIILLVQDQSPIGRQVLLVVGGLFLATAYVLPLGMGVLLVWSAAFAWKKAEYLIKSDVPRLLAISLLTSIIVGGLSQLQWSGISFIFVLVNVGLSLLVMRFTTILSTRGNDDHL